ncbi:MAG: DUF1611 domain-containing protein, partial [Candidatus Eremiobacteraeota bacterium]|nr:DUF1611 domain-containing protein [Candidatus Eremiobacteraeota bacterium]
MPVRRYAILTEGQLLDRRAKTAHGVIQYGRDEIAAVIDAEYAGKDVRDVLPRLQRSAPIVATLAQALAYKPTSLLLGVANQGGFIPQAFRPHILAAIDAGLEIVSGLHQLLRDDPEFVARAKASGARLWDVRLPPEGIPLFSGAAYQARQVVVLAVGSDCAVGKKSVMIELDRAARAAGDRSEFVATGQTGTLIAGKGIVVDRVISDFITGAAEQLVLGVSPDADVALVEGQGSLWHPAYAPVTLGLLFGCAPDLLVMCIDTARTEVEEYGVALPPLSEMIRMHEALLAPIKPARVAAVAVNTSSLPDDRARAAIANAHAACGLPADDVVRFGGARLWRALREAARETPKRRLDAAA